MCNTFILNWNGLHEQVTTLILSTKCPEWNTDTSTNRAVSESLKYLSTFKGFTVGMESTHQALKYNIPTFAWVQGYGMVVVGHSCKVTPTHSSLITSWANWCGEHTYQTVSQTARHACTRDYVYNGESYLYIETTLCIKMKRAVYTETILQELIIS